MTTPAEARFAAALRSARDGDGRGFTTLYDMFEPRVAAFVRVRGVSDPDEVVNDVFLAVFSRIREFRGGAGDFRAWTFRITRNKVADWYRQRERDRRRTEAAGAAAVLDRATETGFETDLTESIIAEDLLTVLTDDQREVLLLRLAGGLTGPETARALDKPLSAVKALQRRALEALRREIRSQAVSN